jgi:hypothetical protein
MSTSFNRLMQSYRNITTICKAIARGDFSRHLEPRSEADELSVAINSMAQRRQEAERQLRESKE